jgi:pimeloyl-ACP methyl ester carboxylesterase
MDQSNVLLVHGAWADASSWTGVIKLLQAAGHNVAAVQLPHTSHALNVAFARRAIAAFAGPVLVAGHSYGGMVMSDASHENDRVMGLVFVAAFGLDEGESLGALAKQGPALPSGSHVRADADGYLSIDPAMFPDDFASDVDLAEARVMAVTQKPIHASIIEAKAGPPGWKEHPSWYQVSELDAMIPPAAEHFFAKRMNAVETLSLASSHASLVAHPREIASFIESAILCQVPS